MKTLLLLGMFGMGHWELLIIFGIILLLFGHRLPGMMRNLGGSVSAFKTGLHEGAEDDDDGEAAKVEKA